MAEIIKFADLKASAEATAFLEKYGDLHESTANLAASICETRNALFEAITGIANRLGKPAPASHESMLAFLFKAAEAGDADANFILRTGALELALPA